MILKVYMSKKVGQKNSQSRFQDEAGTLLDSEIPDLDGSTAVEPPQSSQAASSAPTGPQVGNTSGIMSFKFLGWDCL